MSTGCLPAHLRTRRHDDWPWPLSYIPRAWTSYCHGRFQTPPLRLWGDTPLTVFPGTAWLYPKPIPPPGHWHFADPVYFAATSRGGWHFRLGARFGDVDNYYTIPSLALKRIQ